MQKFPPKTRIFLLVDFTSLWPIIARLYCQLSPGLNRCCQWLGREPGRSCKTKNQVILVMGGIFFSRKYIRDSGLRKKTQNTPTRFWLQNIYTVYIEYMICMKSLHPIWWFVTWLYLIWFGWNQRTRNDQTWDSLRETGKRGKFECSTWNRIWS